MSERWDWLYQLCRRIGCRWEAYRQRRITRWLKTNPDRIKIDGKRIREWNRNRDQ